MKKRRYNLKELPKSLTKNYNYELKNANFPKMH